MSGIEVAGLVLGAIPILLEGLKSYKNGIGTIKAAFQKRKHVEKLSRALLLQRQTLEEIVKQVLLICGCELPPNLNDSPYACLSPVDIQTEIEEGLGSINLLAFDGAVQECLAIVEQLTLRIATFVPAVKDCKDIVRLLRKNKEAKQGQLDFFARVRITFSIRDISDDVLRLDGSVASLNRFVGTISSNRQLATGESSSRAKSLARAYLTIRNHANTLHSAVSSGWSTSCHANHEARLLLDDKFDEALKFRRNRQSGRPVSLSFSMIFTSGVPPSHTLFHETNVLVEEEGQNQDASDNSVTVSHSQIRIALPPTVASAVNNLSIVHDICTEIQEAAKEKHKPRFILTSKGKMATRKPFDQPYDSCPTKHFTTLREMLHDQGRKTILPWKARLTLALKLAGACLQLLRTDWLPDMLTADQVSLVCQPVPITPEAYQPFLLVKFDAASPPVTSSSPATTIRTVFLELGILLLEIWHGESLENKYATLLQHTSNSTLARKAAALEWLEDPMNYLPQHYQTAIDYCLVRLIQGNGGSPEWNDLTLWESYCAGVIEPLSKLKT